MNAMIMQGIIVVVYSIIIVGAAIHCIIVCSHSHHHVKNKSYDIIVCMLVGT
jgi:hypothetical protein